MAAPWWRVALYGTRNSRGFSTTAVLSRRSAPLGPMPNEDIDVSSLESLEKYRSFDRYQRRAESEAKDPHWWKSYRDYFRQPSDPKDKIDIGFPPNKTTQRQQQVLERKKILQENRARMEKSAHFHNVSIPLEEVKADWEKTVGPYHKKRLAEYYGLYQDLFLGATFVPWVPLNVAYNLGEELMMPVFHGNEVTPTEATNPPEVTYEAEKGSLWTLLLTNLDGHLQEQDAEYIHWLVTNIPGNDVSAGQEMCHYLPPFPSKGTGFHRFTFLLFKQHQPIDFSGDARPTPCYHLAMRTFRTFDFYKKHQDSMTPTGLAFFQCRWDDSVTHVYHHLLNMREPVFEFVRPPPYHPLQKKFPHRQPLRYLDRYRDSHEPSYGIY
ncbi:39S ribosomal protein L38, mitochondrial [Monodelphis domestica]|uniref:39S ribosomal protein L38, mitochondrial n=1 Tax=Monodelphis domestica TaxID=13616 RepID=UPI0024E1F0F1|nr:39S ribosomal protein L38, mitochondrial [Monodelphis domestica]